MKQVIMLALALLMTVNPAHPKAVMRSPVELTIIEESDGTRTMVHSVIVRAPVEKVWAAFSTAEGWRSWAVPFAVMDFRVGGIVETSYNPLAKLGDANNIQNKILAYVPKRMFAFQAVKAPAGFPGSELLPSLWSVAEFAPLKGNKTRIRLSGLGYGRDAGRDMLFQFFKRGNGASLEALRDALEQGPKDWRRTQKLAVPPKE